ncbi:hypothetical protein SAMN05421753_11417 [Planctomicrobium piriforme]|uniref:Uncharacterized protein n=1 Tax=Planctomicrobium piriforme TaxID=1576369 RepID=A0A1I3MIR3_9PLAN|nr:hypothetical protein SAMN05421753_11417 [Planctomicrobium piriforme]
MPFFLCSRKLTIRWGFTQGIPHKNSLCNSFAALQYSSLFFIHERFMNFVSGHAETA